MNMGKYMTQRMLVVMFMGAAIGWSVAAENPAAVIAAAVLGMGAIYVLRGRMIKEMKKRNVVLEDERIYRISERASRTTFSVTAIAAAIGGGVLIAMRESHPEYEFAGYLLAFLACGMLLVYLLMYKYYSRKLE